MTTYLYYYYGNYLARNDATDVAGQFLSSDFETEKKAMLNQQLVTALHNRASVVSNIAATTGMGIREVESVLDRIEEDGDFSVSVNENDIAVRLDDLSSTADVEEAMKKLDEAPQWVQTLEDVRQRLNDSLEKAIGDPKLLKQYKKAVLAAYMEDNNLRSVSVASKKIIKGFLEMNDNTVFRLAGDAKNANEVLDKNIKKSIAMLEAVDVALGTEGYSFVGKANVHRSKERVGEYTTTYGTSKLADIFSSKVIHLLTNVNGKLGETAAAHGLVKSFVEYSKEYSDKVTSQLVQSKSFSKVQGNSSIGVNISFTEDPKFKEFMQRANKTVNQFKNRRVKGDVSVLFGDDVDSAEVLFSASVKSLKDISISGDEIGQRVSIKVQDGTPLATFLKREAGLSADGYAGMLQMLVGHEGGYMDEYGYTESELDEAWENMKEMVKYRALLNSLAGFGETKNLFFIVNGSAYSFESVISKIINGGASANLTDNGDKSTEQGLGPRSNYQNLSPWTGPAAPSIRWGRVRSDVAYRHENDVLYKTKVKYGITISGVQNLMSMF